MCRIMKQTSPVKSLASLVMLIVQISHVALVGGTRFSSHVKVHTPATSYSHGVGNPVRLGTPPASYSTSGRRSLKYRSQVNDGGGRGYSRMKPTRPFKGEDLPYTAGYRITPYLHNNFREVSIPLVAPSPYKVDSPDPESLWPEGLFLPPIRPIRFRPTFNRRVDADESSSDPLDPYLLEGSEAIEAVQRARDHGLYYFHDIPHIQSLLAHQELRQHNDLEALSIASIRHTWPYNRN